MSLLTYATDVPGPDYRNTLVFTRDRGGDFMIGVRHESDGLNHGAHFVRFRRANGGASQHPRLIAALVELESVLQEIGGA